MYYDLDLCDLSAHEARVLKELSEFINLHQPGATLSTIDDIVLAYVVGVLDDLGNEDDFDVDNFVEMIGAYVPGFESIEIAVVCEWIFSLSEKLKYPGEKDDQPCSAQVDVAPVEIPSPEKGTPSLEAQQLLEESTGSNHHSNADSSTEVESEESFYSGGDLSLDYMPNFDEEDDLELDYLLGRAKSPIIESILDPINESSRVLPAGSNRRGFEQAQSNIPDNGDHEGEVVESIWDPIDESCVLPAGHSRRDFEQFQNDVSDREEHMQDVVESIWDPIDGTCVLPAGHNRQCFEQAQNNVSDGGDHVQAVEQGSNPQGWDGEDTGRTAGKRSRYVAKPEQLKRVLDVIPGADLEQVEECLVVCNGVLDATVAALMRRMNLVDDDDKNAFGISSSCNYQVVFKTKAKQHSRDRRHRRKSRKASGGSSVEADSKTYKENVIPVNETEITDAGNPARGVDSERLLLEMFPSASPVDARQCLAISKGDTEVACQLLMEKVDSGEIQDRPRVVAPLQNANKVLDDREQRQMLLQKYGFVDSEESGREHRPFLRKSEETKQVRYYDSKPVTSSGEKFFEVKDPT